MKNVFRVRSFLRFCFFGRWKAFYLRLSSDDDAEKAKMFVGEDEGVVKGVGDEK